MATLLMAQAASFLTLVLWELAQYLKHASIDGLLGLLVCLCDNIAHMRKKTGQDIEFQSGHKVYHPEQDPSGHHMMDALMEGLCEVGCSPAGV